MTHAISRAALANHIGIVGKTGSGKTYAAKGLIEGLLDDGARVCVVDPTGVFWGLRQSADGKSAGYPVAIFGGLRGDFPLSAAHGEAVAEIIGTSSTPTIVDTSQLTVGERTRFFAAFADALFRKNRGPLHLVIDEAHLFAPQGRVADPASGQMLHAANNLVSLGRARGLRIVLISQRPAKLHKDALTQVETLVAMRLVAPQDRAAVDDWIEDNADVRQRETVIGSLASLKTGEGWVWSPGNDGLHRVRFPAIRTLDSSAAPDGDAAETPLSPIDRSTIASRLEAVAAEIVANDPRTLRARIAELEGQLSRSAGCSPEDVGRARRVGYEEGYREGFVAGRQGARERALAAIRRAGEALHAACAEAEAEAPAEPAVVTTHPPLAAMEPATRHAVVELARAATTFARGTAMLSKAERLILGALAHYPQGRTRVQAAILTGYASEGGGFRNAIGSLRTRGYVDGLDPLTITPAGRKALGPVPPLPTGRALLDHWLAQLSKAERGILAALAGAYPRAMTREQVAAATGYEAAGGGFRNALGRLRTLELVHRRDTLRASADLCGSGR